MWDIFWGNLVYKAHQNRSIWPIFKALWIHISNVYLFKFELSKFKVSGLGCTNIIKTHLNSNCWIILHKYNRYMLQLTPKQKCVDLILKISVTFQEITVVIYWLSVYDNTVETTLLSHDDLITPYMIMKTSFLLVYLIKKP